MSELDNQPIASESGAPSSIGRVLRLAREARGESQIDAAYALKLTQRQIDAMEQERFDLLPGPAFVRGFLRNYAKHLGVDIEHQLAQVGGQQAVPGQTVVLTPPANAKGTIPDRSEGRKAPVPTAAIVVGMIAVLGAGWYFDWFNVGDAEPEGAPREALVEPRREVLPEVPPTATASSDRTPATIEAAEPAAAEAGDGVGSDATAGGEATALNGVPAPASAPASAPAVAESQTVTNGDGAATASAAPAAVTPPVRNDTTVATGGVAEAAAAEPPADAEVAPPAASPESLKGTLVFRMGGESWIQVRDATGTTLYMGIGAAGTTRTVQGTAPFAIVVGNATEVVVEHEGRPVDLTPHIRTGVARMTVE